MKRRLLFAFGIFLFFTICAYSQSVIGARVTEIDTKESSWTYINYELINSSNKSGWFDIVHISDTLEHLKRNI